MMAEIRQLHQGNLSIQLESLTMIKETLQDTKSNNEKFWNLERTRNEDNSQRSREALRELKKRLLNGCEQSDQNDEKLKDLSRSICEVCNQIETNIQKMNEIKHGTSGDKKKQNGVKTTKQLSGDTSRDGVRNVQRHHVTPQRKQDTEERAPTETSCQLTDQQLAPTMGTQGDQDTTDLTRVGSVKKENKPELSAKVKVSSPVSGISVPTRIVPQCQGLPKPTTTRPKPSVITRNDFGLKRLKTETEGDNRLTYLMEHSQGGARSQSRGRRMFADLKLENLNISTEDVSTNKGETEETTDHMTQLLSHMEDDTDLFPGLSSILVGADLEAVTGIRKWFTFAEHQKNNGVKPRRGKGPDTVLCLDTSKSMEGARFQEMISIALNIVNGIEEIASVLNIPENISVTTFGEDARVVLHLTNDYSKVKGAIKSLHTAKGTTPMAGGLLVALAGVLGNNTCGHTFLKGIPIPGRIIMISDGLGTPDHVTEGDDVVTDTKSQMLVECHLKDVSANLKERSIRVYCIPVRNAKMHLLETVSSITRGKVYRPSDFHRLVKMAQTTHVACELVHAVFLDTVGENDEDVRKRLELVLDGAADAAGRAQITRMNTDREDILDLSMFLRSIIVELGGKDEAKVREQFDSDLPPLGTRMRRGPGWHYPDHQDNRGPGTVFAHGKSGMVWVEWDNGHKNCYNYENKAMREIVEVDEPRILKDQLIATGCRVKRGPDWRPKLKDQDGGPGNMGTVIRVHRNGRVDVRWDNKKIANYRFGFDGKFELELCSEANSSRSQRPTDLTNVNEDDGLLIESFLDPVEVMNRRNKMKSDN